MPRDAQDTTFMSWQHVSLPKSNTYDKVSEAVEYKKIVRITVERAREVE